MGISIIEIKETPHHKLMGETVDDAKRCAGYAFADMISHVASVNAPETVVIEIVFYKGMEEYPRLFITLRGNEQAGPSTVGAMTRSILSRLSDNNYVAEELTDAAFAETVGAFRNQLSGRVVALTKSEKIVSSAISYAGYYYYTDVLENTGGKAPEPNNHNALFHELMACKQAMVAFQLIPTRITPEEHYSLSSLSGELATTTQGVFVNRQMLREASAEAPRKTYTYYVDRASQPLFLANVIVASAGNPLEGLISAIKTGIQSAIAEPISLTSIELVNDRSLTYDYFRFPWNLHCQLLFNYRDGAIWNGTAFQPTNLMRLPFLVTANEAVSFFRLPIDDGKIQGVHTNRAGNDNEIISPQMLDSNNIVFGNLINSRNKQIGISASEFTRHALVVGTPGSGKTTFALNMLLQFHLKGIPFLAIEPTKTEYRALVDKIPDLQVFTPGNSGVVPFIINPFLPPKGIRVEQYIPSLVSAFRAAFSMESPLDVIFQKVIRQCYAQYGWKNNSLCTDADVQPFGMHEFVLEFKKQVASSNYKAETKANIETGGTYRLLNLLDQNKYIFDTVNTIPIDQLLDNPTVIELNAIADIEQKALIMALLLINICLYIKNRGSISGGIRNILMIDEAHVLLGSSAAGSAEQAKAQNTTISTLQGMIAEIRAFGTGVIIADQMPSKVTLDIVANTDLKVAFRLVEQNERNIIANSTNMTEQQSQHLARLKKGEAMIFCSLLDTSKTVVTPDARKTNGIRHHVSDDEIAERGVFWNSQKDLLIPFFECRSCPQCKKCGSCNFAIREKAEYYSSHIISTIGTRVKDREILTKYMFHLQELINKYEDVCLSIRNCIKRAPKSTVPGQHRFGFEKPCFCSL